VGASVETDSGEFVGIDVVGDFDGSLVGSIVGICVVGIGEGVSVGADVSGDFDGGIVGSIVGISVELVCALS